MNPKVTLEVDVLEVSARDYTGKDGSARQFRSTLVRLDGKVLKFSVSKEGFESLKSEEGKTTVVVVELSTFGDNLEPRLTVVGVGRNAA